MANWICVKCYPAIYKQSKDRPNPEREIWEDQGHPENNSNHMEKPRLMFNGVQVSCCDRMDIIPAFKAGGRE